PGAAFGSSVAALILKLLSPRPESKVKPSVSSYCGRIAGCATSSACSLSSSPVYPNRTGFIAATPRLCYAFWPTTILLPEAGHNTQMSQNIETTITEFECRDLISVSQRGLR